MESKSKVFSPKIPTESTTTNSGNNNNANSQKNQELSKQQEAFQRNMTCDKCNQLTYKPVVILECGHLYCAYCIYSIDKDKQLVMPGN